MKLADTLSDLVPSGSAFYSSETGFKSYSYSILNPGTYTLSIGIVDVTDDLVSSGLVVDNTLLNSSFVSAVPEPSTMAILSVLGLAAIRLREKKKA